MLFLSERMLCCTLSKKFPFKKRAWNEYEKIFNLLVVVYKYEKWGKGLKSQIRRKHEQEGKLFLLNESKNLNHSAPSDD